MRRPGTERSGRAGPLGGASVVVTRPRSAHGGSGAPARDRLSEALDEAGARVLAVPAIEIAAPEDDGRALADAVARLGEHRWVVFTSRHAVDRVLGLLGGARVPDGVRVAAVGSATAEALGGYGVAADLVPAMSSAEGLVAEFPEPGTADRGDPADPARPADARARRVLFPAADRARPTLPDGLRAMGWEVDEVVAYRTVAAPTPPSGVLDDVAAAHAITFSSPSAVRSYLAMRTASGSPVPVPPLVVCIGAVTAAAARDAALPVAVEAPVGEPAALVAALAARLGEAGARS